MDPEIIAQIDQLVAAAQAKLEAEKAQIRKDAQNELLSQIKSKLGL
jgi:hypothetical protein